MKDSSKKRIGMSVFIQKVLTANENGRKRKRTSKLTLSDVNWRKEIVYMRVPKNIEKLLSQRIDAAIQVQSADYKLAVWLEKNGIEVEEYDILGGVEIYGNPDSSAERIRQAILNR